MPLASIDPSPPLDVVEVLNPKGAGDVVFVCEHASNAIPAEFADLGLPAELLTEHIAWDPGALPVAAALSARFDAPLVASRISRLVYDCNRPPDAPSAVPETSERYEIPGNRGLSLDARADRAARFYEPFRAALAAVLDARPGAALVTIHSFTAVYLGVRRTVDAGIIHDRDSRLADALLAACPAAGIENVGRNVPYTPADGVTHTLVQHALPRGRRNAMVEIRNDLIADAAGVRLWADRLGTALAAALTVATEARA